MFARHITLQLNPSLAKEFSVTFEREIVPLLKSRSEVARDKGQVGRGATSLKRKKQKE
jgi:hypothetical protein